MADVLKTDYVNDVLNTDVNTERTYNLVDANGNIIYEGVKIRETTVFSKVGDTYGSSEINEQNTTINQLNTDIEQLDNDLDTKANTNSVVAKSGDTMSGNLTIQGLNRSLNWQDMNGNNLRRHVWAGFANSGGDFYMWDTTNRKEILGAPSNGAVRLNGIYFRINNGVAQYSTNGSTWLNFKNPTGTKSITANGTYDITDYASASVNVHPTPNATVISAYTPTPTGPGPHSLNVPAGYSRYLFSIISNSGSGDTTCTGCGATRIAHVSPSGGPCLDTYLLTSSGTISFTGKNWVPSVTLIGLNS